MSGRGSTRLRAMLNGGGMIEVPGAHDVLTAKLIENVGFSAVYVGGMPVAAVDYGLPDIGIISYDLLLERAARVTHAVNIPVVIDLDNGGGSPLTIRRAVTQAASSGVAGLHIEDVDYAFGKHLLTENRRSVDPSRDRLLPIDQAAENVWAAVAARASDDIVIIARTDALATDGLDEALQRAKVFASAGADLVFLPYLRAADVATAVKSIDCGLMMFPTERFDPALRHALASNGVRVLLHPSPTLMPSFAASLSVLEELRSGHTTDPLGADKSARKRFREAVHWPEWTDWALRDRE